MTMFVLVVYQICPTYHTHVPTNYAFTSLCIHSLNTQGLNWAANCFNLPEQHFLGWTTPSVVTVPTQLLPGVPRAVAVPRRADLPPQRTRRGVVLRFPGLDSVYLDYLVRGSSGFGALQPWLDGHVAVHTFAWDGISFQPGYFTSKMTSFEGTLPREGDVMVLQVRDGAHSVFLKCILGKCININFFLCVTHRMSCFTRRRPCRYPTRPTLCCDVHRPTGHGPRRWCGCVALTAAHPNAQTGFRRLTQWSWGVDKCISRGKHVFVIDLLQCFCCKHHRAVLVRSAGCILGWCLLGCLGGVAKALWGRGGCHQ